MGRFSSSSCHLLCGKSLSNKTAQDYIQMKAMESLFGIRGDDNVNTYAMQRGTDLEPEAHYFFQDRYKIELITGDYRVTKKFVSSPDAVWRYKPYLNEVKCPEKLYKHLYYLVKIRGKGATEALKKIEPRYYWQVQSQMWIYEAEAVYFCSFHPEAPIAPADIPKLGVTKGQNLVMWPAKIERCGKDIEFLKKRVNEAWDMKNTLI